MFDPAIFSKHVGKVEKCPGPTGLFSVDIGPKMSRT